MTSTYASSGDSYWRPIGREPDQHGRPPNDSSALWSFMHSSIPESGEGAVGVEHVVQEQVEAVADGEEDASVLQTNELRQEDLASFYIIPEAEKIHQFLECNSFLVPILFTAALKIKEFFLDVEQRIDLDDEYEDDLQLVITIITTSSADKAVQQLQQFFNQWWLDMPNDAKLKLYFSLEFR